MAAIFEVDERCLHKERATESLGGTRSQETGMKETEEQTEAEGKERGYPRISGHITVLDRGGCQGTDLYVLAGVSY